MEVSKQMPLVTVIIPVYNVEKYLHDCVDSILSQTFADFELILVDDGSSDSSPAICDEYAISREVALSDAEAFVQGLKEAGFIED